MLVLSQSQKYMSEYCHGKGLRIVPGTTDAGHKYAT